MTEVNEDMTEVNEDMTKVNEDMTEVNEDMTNQNGGVPLMCRFTSADRTQQIFVLHSLYSCIAPSIPVSSISNMNTPHSTI